MVGLAGSVEAMVLVEPMAAGPHRGFTGGNGTHRVIQVAHFCNWIMTEVAATAQFVSCGELVDPILLTQRTYNR
jgi:hypothetical protein